MTIILLPLLIFYLLNISSTSASPPQNSKNNFNDIQQNINSNKHKRQLKILVHSPSLSWSHAQYLGRIADTLVDAGHEVHFFKFIMDPNLNFKNETSRVKHIYIIKANPESVEHLDIKNNKLVTESFTSNRPLLTYFNHPMLQFAPMMGTACKETIKQHKLLQKLTNEHFDIGIAEMYEYCAAALFHKLGVKTKLAAFAVPVLQMTVRKFDIPSFASFVPNTFAPRLGLESSFFNRFLNFYNEFYDWVWMDDYILREEKIKNILAKATAGAVLFSFGSIADTTKLNKNIKNAIISAFKRFPKIQFIWKLDSETIKNISELINNIPNIHIFEWLQQPAILAHPNLKAFITHCGQNSLTESVHAGVPIIGIPLFGDQFYNADVAFTHRIGLQIDVNELNGQNGENILFEAIERILQDPSFHQNAQILSKKLLSTPFEPKERLVKWVEFSAEFENLSELDLPGDLELNWFIYYSIDKTVRSAYNLPLSQRILPYAFVASAVLGVSSFIVCVVNPFGIRKLKGKEKN
uniref:UDP-glucuronosyltransferase n=1 Tax=Meloidogyne hapla TaxID=6305 RepID=A0A1I8BC99_MELHA